MWFKKKHKEEEIGDIPEVQKEKVPTVSDLIISKIIELISSGEIDWEEEKTYSYDKISFLEKYNAFYLGYFLHIIKSISLPYYHCRIELRINDH